MTTTKRYSPKSEVLFGEIVKMLFLNFTKGGSPYSFFLTFYQALNKIERSSASSAGGSVY
jgi:hypothetical protein